MQFALTSRGGQGPCAAHHCHGGGAEGLEVPAGRGGRGVAAGDQEHARAGPWAAHHHQGGGAHVLEVLAGQGDCRGGAGRGQNRFCRRQGSAEQTRTELPSGQTRSKEGRKTLSSINFYEWLKNKENNIF